MLVGMDKRKLDDQDEMEQHFKKIRVDSPPNLPTVNSAPTVKSITISTRNQDTHEAVYNNYKTINKLLYSLHRHKQEDL